MINVKDQVYGAIQGITENVSDTYPKEWAVLPAIQYTEEDNSVVEWVDNKESKAHLLYKVDIWNKCKHLRGGFEGGCCHICPGIEAHCMW